MTAKKRNNLRDQRGDEPNGAKVVVKRDEHVKI